MLDGLARTPYLSETVENLFANVWAAPHLSMRDKRLLVIGATTMLGRADLLEVQIAGAIANKEITDEQFEEMTLLMLFYAGAGNTTALSRGIDAAKKRAETLVKPDRSRHRSCSHRNAVAGATGKPHRSTIARPANQAEGVRARGARRTPNGSQRILFTASQGGAAIRYNPQRQERGAAHVLATRRHCGLSPAR